MAKMAFFELLHSQKFLNDRKIQKLPHFDVFWFDHCYTPPEFRIPFLAVFFRTLSQFFLYINQSNKRVRFRRVLTCFLLIHCCRIIQQTLKYLPTVTEQPIKILLIFLHFPAAPITSIFRENSRGLNNTLEAMGQHVQKAATDAATKAVADAAAKEMSKQMGNLMSGGFRRK